MSTWERANACIRKGTKLLSNAFGPGYTWVFAGPWLAMVCLAIWIVSTMWRLLRHDVTMRREITALTLLARALSPRRSEPDGGVSEHLGSARPRRPTAPEQLLALRGTAVLGPRIARTAADWLLLARAKVTAERHTPELVRLGLGFALDREVHTLVQTARGQVRQLIPLALATTACGLVGALLALTRAATSISPGGFDALPMLAPVITGALATLAAGFFFGCLTVFASLIANGRCNRAHRQLTELVAEIELHAQRP